jgi:hypothetical protein
MKIRLALIIIIVIFQLINSNLSAQQTQKAPFFEVEVFDSTFIDLNSIGITASTISLAFAYDNLVPFDIPNEYHSVWGMFYAKDFWPIYRKDLFKPTNGSAPTSTAQAYDLDESNNYQSVYEFADRTNESEPNGQYKLMDDKQNVILDYYGIPLNPEIHGGGYSSDKKYHYPVVETIAYNGDDDERDFMIYEDLYVYSIQTGENRKVFDYLHHAGTTMGIPEYQYAGTPDIIGAFIDRTHVNAVDDHPFEDAAIVSYRHNAVWKVNYIEGSEVGEVDWILGGPPVGLLHMALEKWFQKLKGKTYKLVYNILPAL